MLIVSLIQVLSTFDFQVICNIYVFRKNTFTTTTLNMQMYEYLTIQIRFCLVFVSCLLITLLRIYCYYTLQEDIGEMLYIGQG